MDTKEKIDHAIRLCRTMQDLNYAGLSKEAADDFIDSLLYFLTGEVEHTHVKNLGPKHDIRKDNIQEITYEAYKELMESKDE